MAEKIRLGVGLVDRIQPAAEIVNWLAEDAISVLLKASSLIQQDLRKGCDGTDS